METKDKNREAARKRRPQQGSGSRPPEDRPRQRAARAAAAQTEPQRQLKSSRQPRQEPPRSAPQGTGPRKSAPKPSPQEQAAVRKRAEAQHRAAQRKAAEKAAEKAAKKNALHNMIAGNLPSKEEQAQKKAEEAQRRKAKRAAAAERKRKRAQQHDTPAVMYTAPQVFNRSRLAVQLLTVVAVVVALVLGMSVFFKVKTISVAGAESYSLWAVREASGIQEGDNLLTFSRARANAQIREKLPYVEKSRIGIKLPDTVIIYIEEMDVAYAIQSDDSTWWLMNATGRVVEQINEEVAGNYTKILGVALDSPEAGKDAIAVEDLPTETDASGEYIPVTVTGAQRLYTVLQILQSLEDNDIVGEAASVDVSRLDDIILWYGNRFQVNLGDTSRLDYKIDCMSDGILSMSQYDSGILDISFTFWPDQIGYTPFD